MGNSVSQGRFGSSGKKEDDGGARGVTGSGILGGVRRKKQDLRRSDYPQSAGTRYKACDSEGLPDQMRSPGDSIEHFPSSESSPAYACSSVKGLRREMEDEHVAARPLLSQDGENVNLFGVFDGHGGQHCSKYLHQNLAPVVCKSVERTWHSGSTEDAIKAAFRDVDSAFLASIGNEDVGSTAVVVLLKGRTLYCANTGDSRAILCRADGTTMLSCDHKPNRPDEKKRIEAAGGVVIFNRVMGRLGVSRAFGDKSLKHLVIADPDVVTMPLKEDDDFVVLACDGLWDVVDNDTVAELVRSHAASKGLESAAQALTTYAIRNGSCDNVTCMIVDVRTSQVPLAVQS